MHAQIKCLKYRIKMGSERVVVPLDAFAERRTMSMHLEISTRGSLIPELAFREIGREKCWPLDLMSGPMNSQR